jgi:hypothetical protein
VRILTMLTILTMLRRSDPKNKREKKKLNFSHGGRESSSGIVRIFLGSQRRSIVRIVSIVRICTPKLEWFKRNCKSEDPDDADDELGRKRNRLT